MQNIPNDNNKPVFINILGDKRIVSEIILLLADIRHALTQDDEINLNVKINSRHKANPILFTVNNQEIEDYKPELTNYIN
jgi:hypothetical protein